MPAMNDCKSLPKGDLAVIFDKNPVEAKGCSVQHRVSALNLCCRQATVTRWQM